MDYKKIYDLIVERAQSSDRKKSKSHPGEYEEHHVIPLCIGGTDEKHNLAILIPKEHFICHKLLVEIYPSHKGILFALWMMVNGMTSGSQERNYKVSAREYHRIKTIQAKHMSEIMKGRFVGELNPMYGKTGELNPFYGKSHPEEFIEFMRWFSSNREKKECPHCGIVMNYVNADQFHFNNCLQNPNITEEQIHKRIHHMDAAIESSLGVIECPYCHIICRKVNASKYHFENCEQAPTLSEVTENRIRQREETDARRLEKLLLKERKFYICPHCSLESYDWTNMHRYHFENCKENPDRVVTLYKCIYCGLETENKTNITRFHDENCKCKPKDEELAA
jgi:hypothetical protein